MTSQPGVEYGSGFHGYGGVRLVTSQPGVGYGSGFHGYAGVRLVSDVTARCEWEPSRHGYDIA